MTVASSYSFDKDKNDDGAAAVHEWFIVFAGAKMIAYQVFLLLAFSRIEEANECWTPSNFHTEYTNLLGTGLYFYVGIYWCEWDSLKCLCADAMDSLLDKCLHVKVFPASAE